MLPTSNEFIGLYVLYSLIIIYFGYLFRISNSRLKVIETFLLVFIIGCNFVLFIDEENFKYGGSLAVLFLSTALLIINFIILLIINYIMFRHKKNLTMTKSKFAHKAGNIYIYLALTFTIIMWTLMVYDDWHFIDNYWHTNAAEYLLSWFIYYFIYFIVFTLFYWGLTLLICLIVRLVRKFR